MNQRDRLFVQRELIAWADWMRDGRTFQNTLGYKSSTVEWALMRGEVGGYTVSGPLTPSRFNDDRNVSTIDRVFWKMPVKPREAVSGVYVYRFTQQRTAEILGITRKQVGRRLDQAYSIVFGAICGECPTSQKKAIVSDCFTVL